MSETRPSVVEFFFCLPAFRISQIRDCRARCHSRNDVSDTRSDRDSSAVGHLVSWHRPQSSLARVDRARPTASPLSPASAPSARVVTARARRTLGVSRSSPRGVSRPRAGLIDSSATTAGPERKRLTLLLTRSRAHDARRPRDRARGLDRAASRASPDARGARARARARRGARVPRPLGARGARLPAFPPHPTSASRRRGAPDAKKPACRTDRDRAFLETDVRPPPSPRSPFASRRLPLAAACA